MGCGGRAKSPCECLTGDTVSWLWNGLNALEEPPAGRMQRRRAAGLLANGRGSTTHTVALAPYLIPIAISDR